MSNHHDNSHDGTDDHGHDDGRRDVLGPGDTGRWLVTTQGSSHIWDLDELTYTRIPGQRSLSGSFKQDLVGNPITRVERWPRVGEVFVVWFDDLDYPEYVEQWRQSSWVDSIEPLPDNEQPTGTTDDTDPTETDTVRDASRRVPVANGVLSGVHPPSACEGQPWGCWVHSPRPHSLSDAPVKWREDKQTAERVCPHGIGHPDPQDSAYWWHVHGRDVTVHGCDGCCHPKPDWLTDLTDGAD